MAPAGRPASTQAGSATQRRGSTWLWDPNGLAASLKACAGEGDPVSAAAKAAALAFSAVPDAPAPPSEIFALWVFDIVLAIRLRWPRPVPLIATKILDPTLRSPGAGRRPRPGDPAWPNAAAGAIALAAASALDLAADLSRRSSTLLAVAPKLRSKPAQKIVDLLLAEDCVSAAEAARQAPMTDRAARRLFDRLVVLGAARELPAGLRSGCTAYERGVPPPTTGERRAARRRARRSATCRALARMECCASKRPSSPPPDPCHARRSPRRLRSLRVDDLVAISSIELAAALTISPWCAGGYAFARKPVRPGSSAPPYPGLAGDGVSDSTRTETFALTAVAYLQPVTRGEISKLAGREISRDVVARKPP